MTNRNTCWSCTQVTQNLKLICLKLFSYLMLWCTWTWHVKMSAWRMFAYVWIQKKNQGWMYQPRRFSTHSSVVEHLMEVKIKFKWHHVWILAWSVAISFFPLQKMYRVWQKYNILYKLIIFNSKYNSYCRYIL